MNLDQLKQEAVREASLIEINWEAMDNPHYRADFEHVLKRACEFLPELEGIYTKLTSGKSVLIPGEDTSLSYEDIEKYTQVISEELLSGYVLQEVYRKYEMVNAVIDADINGPLDKGDPTQLDLDI